MTEARLEAFVRGVAFQETDLTVDVLVGIIRSLITRTDASCPDRTRVWSEVKIEDRVLVKLAALSLAFFREVRDVFAGNFELDFRDEAILDAVVEHLSKVRE